MKKLILATMIVAFVASCGGGSKAPRNLDNACSIVRQQPKILRAMKKTERKWNVPVHVQMAGTLVERRCVAVRHRDYRVVEETARASLEAHDVVTVLGLLVCNDCEVNDGRLGIEQIGSLRVHLEGFTATIT